MKDWKIKNNYKSIVLKDHKLDKELQQIFDNYMFSTLTHFMLPSIGHMSLIGFNSPASAHYILIDDVTYSVLDFIFVAPSNIPLGFEETNGPPIIAFNFEMEDEDDIGPKPKSIKGFLLEESYLELGPTKVLRDRVLYEKLTQTDSMFEQSLGFYLEAFSALAKIEYRDLLKAL